MKKSLLKIIAGVMTLMLVFTLVSIFAISSPDKQTEQIADVKEETVPNVDIADAMTKGINPYITYQTKGTLVSAHRAGGALAPENTLSAFQACLKNDVDNDGKNEYDVDVLEFDLHLTADGNLILLHDDTLDRTSNCNELFGEKDVKPITKTLEQLKLLNMAYNFVDENGKTYRDLSPEEIDKNGYRITTLEEVLNYCEKTRPDQSLNYIIEIKDSGENGKIAADKLYTTVRDLNLLNRVIVGTFNGDITDYLDSTYPTMIRSAGILEVLRIFICYLLNRDLGEVKYDVLQIPYLSWFPFLGSAKFISFAHRYNIACQFWTINDRADMVKLIQNGADCIITDNPKVGYDVTKEVRYNLPQTVANA